MIASCTSCGHRLWSEVRSAGAFRFLAHSDDDERSPTCPGCGVRLDLGLSGAEAPTHPPDRG